MYEKIAIIMIIITIMNIQITHIKTAYNKLFLKSPVINDHTTNEIKKTQIIIITY